MTAPTASTAAPVARFRHKTTVGLLAALFGCVGAHWWYLGRRRAWLVSAIGVALLIACFFAKVWYENPAFFLLFIPMIDGFIEAVVLCVMSDAKFDGFYNQGLVRQKASGWGAILVAIFTLLFGTIVMMFGIAMIVMYVWEALGWLEGFDLNSD